MKSGRNNKLNRRQAQTYFLVHKSDEYYTADAYEYNSKCYIEKLAKLVNRSNQRARSKFEYAYPYTVKAKKYE